MTQNPDTLPTPHDLAGPCPRCGRVSNFQDSFDEFQLRRFKRDGGHFREFLNVLTCLGCQDQIVVITNRNGKGVELELVHIYPAPGAGVLDEAVPQSVASAYDEGVRCLSIGAFRAAAVMFRSALSLFVKDKGGESAKKERHLKSALKRMKNDGSLHSSLWDWADHLNQLGNEGAHPEDYDDVTAEEAATLGEFVKHLIVHEYEMPAKLLRARGLSTSVASKNETVETQEGVSIQI